jgi:uncharacterized protein
MRCVIDTNCFLAILPKKSKYRLIFDAYRQGEFELAISNEILSEYSEIFTIKMNFEISENIIELILKQSNTIEVGIYFKWFLITIDIDDNKFVDTFIASSSDYIVTYDKHFKSLNKIQFPKVKVIDLDEFLNILKSKS